MDMFSLDTLTKGAFTEDTINHKDIINHKLIESRRRLKEAGADFVIDTLDELPTIIKSI
jgi:hypothetical protein